MKFTTAIKFDGFVQEAQPKVQVVLASHDFFRKRYWVLVNDERVNECPIKEKEANQFANAIRSAWVDGAMQAIRSI